MARLLLGDISNTDAFVSRDYVDLHDEEHVTLTSSIKKVEELTAIFTEHTQEFTIPATPKNVALFRHYDVIGLELPEKANPHKAIPAILIISEGNELLGRVELRGVTYKEGTSNSFLIVFYGNLISVKAQLENKILNVCSSSHDAYIDYDSKFDVTFTYAAIVAEWDKPEPDAFVPIVDHTQDYKYVVNEEPDGDGNYLQNNIAPQPGNPTIPDGWGGVRWENLRPAYNMKGIVQDILEKSITKPSGDLPTVSFHTKISDYLAKAYFIPKAGEDLFIDHVTNNDKFKVGLHPPAPATHAFADDWAKIPMGEVVYDQGGNYDAADYKYTVSSQGTHTFTITIDGETGALLAKKLLLGVVRRNSLGVELYSKNWEIKSIKSSGTNKFEGTWTIQIYGSVGDTFELHWNKQGPGWSGHADFLWWEMIDHPTTIVGTPQSVCRFMPEMNAYEFITGFLRSYNCLLIADKDNNLEIIDTQSFYNRGTERDFTSYVDITNISSRKLTLPKKIELRYAENEAYWNTQWYTKYGDHFGEFTIIFDTDFSSDTQELASIFSITRAELLPSYDSTISNDTFLGLVDIIIPSQIDETGDPVKTDFLAFFYSGIRKCVGYRFQNGIDSNDNATFTDLGGFPLVEPYFYTSDVNLRRTLTYNQIAVELPGDELIEFLRTARTEFFQEWNQRLGDKNTRKIVFNGSLPVHEYSKLKLNDNISIDGGIYIINELQYDWLDNSIKMTLVTFDDDFTTQKITSIQSNGITVVTTCRGQVCRTNHEDITPAFLESNDLTINGRDELIWGGITRTNVGTRYPVIGGSPAEGEGYHKYVLDIPTPVTPISVGDVMAYYNKQWRKADSSREERTAQGAVVKIDGTKYTLIRFGDIEVRAHGYDLNTWYWLKADGTYVKDKPAKLAQLLFYVYDADTLQFNIEQPITQIEEKLGWIHIGEHPAVGWTFTPTRLNTFEEVKIDIPHFDAANVRSFTLEPTTNRVKLDFPVRPEEPVFVQITIMVALSLESGSTRNIEIAHGVDGAVSSSTDWYNQHYGTNLPALGVYVPITYNWSGQVKNEHTISIFLRTDTTEQIIGFAKSIQVTGQI